MIKNTGKSSEARFEAYWKSFGKRAYLERRIDLAHVRGLNPDVKGLKLPPQPSDYMLTVEGVTSYAEVKSCSNKTSFPFSQIETGQWTAMVQVVAAGGKYVFFLHNLETNTWYAVPGNIIKTISEQGKQSVKWAELEPFRYLIP